MHYLVVKQPDINTKQYSSLHLRFFMNTPKEVF